MTQQTGINPSKLRPAKAITAPELARLCLCWLPVVAALCSAPYAHASNDFIVAPVNGDISGAELSTRLASADITLTSSSGGKSGAGNIIIRDAVKWSSNHTLTLNASNSVIVQDYIIASGDSAGLVISPRTANGSEQPTTAGEFSLGPSSITLSGTAPRLIISGATYQVINSLGAAADAITPPASPTLQAMAAAANLTNNYALGADIDARAATTWNYNSGFMPIGTSISPFKGKFDGLGHRISNLPISRINLMYVGLFGATNNLAVVRNVGLVNAAVTGNTNVGGLVGDNAGLITQSYTEGVVSAKGLVGGLVGYNRTGTIKRSYSKSSISFLPVALPTWLAGWRARTRAYWKTAMPPAW